jgi:hypothetical protein
MRRTDLHKEISIKPFDSRATQMLQRVGKLTMSLFAAALFRQFLIFGRSTAAAGFSTFLSRKITRENNS